MLSSTPTTLSDTFPSAVIEGACTADDKPIPVKVTLTLPVIPSLPRLVCKSCPVSVTFASAVTTSVPKDKDSD